MDPDVAPVKPGAPGHSGREIVPWPCSSETSKLRMTLRAVRGLMRIARGPAVRSGTATWCATGGDSRSSCHRLNRPAMVTFDQRTAILTLP